MRISESKIKEAISHTDISIQMRAANYFKSTFSTDPEISTLILNKFSDQGIEFQESGLISKISNLNLTDDNIGSLIEQLNIESNDVQHIRSILCNELLRTDRDQFLNRYQEIIDSRYFIESRLYIFKLRKELLAYDESRCWKELEDYCMKRTAFLSPPFNEDAYHGDLELGWCFSDAIARFGWNCEERILSILSRETVDNQTENAMDATGLEFLQNVAVHIAGLLKMESMVPVMVSRLCNLEENEYLNRLEVESLVRIGTQEVIDLIALNYLISNEEFQFHSKDILEDIKTDHAYTTCRQLLASTDNLECRFDLAEAMINHFETDAIEFGRELVLANTEDMASESLRESLIECCTIMDQFFPEFDTLSNTGYGDEYEYQDYDDDDALMKMFQQQLVHELQTQGDYFSPQPMIDVDVSEAVQRQIPMAGKTFKAGRNDSCPCGSGKKFKKCCINNG